MVVLKRTDLCAGTMSFKFDTYLTLPSGSGTLTTAIADVGVQTPTVLSYSTDTSLEEYKCVNTWTVKGLKALNEGTTSLESAQLTHQNSSKWCMVLMKKANELHLCFKLIHTDAGRPLRAKLKADEILPSGEMRPVFPCKWYSLKNGEKTETQVVRRLGADQENNNENEIVLQCEVCMQCVAQENLPVAEVPESQSDVLRDMDELLHKEVLTDFELHVEGTVLKAHKALLSVRSAYFAAMLQPHTKESKEGYVEIRDVKPEVLKQILAYVYTGKAPALTRTPWDLLIAADKYQLQQLKRQCERHIAGCLSVENAASTAAYASLYTCDLLWDRAVLFIKHNLLQVMRSPGWAETIAAHPEAIQRISELMQ